ncbi:DNA alkylation repair protein [Arenimonas terrae]|uniref:DNA alkylation repair protein n=1 Tax=Arenimonas terrae TaxID=2546226 RepID=A0A5C4RPM7_9GAMM|nr:DNA alkylation repair protein [Arenimonas terrae]TNJ32681.1 DNA alkylation repair protein [Arenimonas terrae]
MADAFKNLINPALVRACGEHLQRRWRDFDRRGFERLALRGLADLEMKARAMQIADALEATLPEDFDRAAGLIESALAPAATGDSLDFRSTETGLAGWIGWPLGEFLARRGQAEPERGLRALHALTQRFTGEFAIRPYLVNHFDLTLRTLSGWTGDRSAHVRRLVSEGSRPRLPWGLQIKALITDPTPTLPLLRALQDDGSEYVRRSVANHLNDIAKDHPGVVADWLETHLPDATPERRALLKHASRTLVKKGDGRVLAAWGLGAPFRGEATLAITPRRVAVGGAVALQLTLVSTSAKPQLLAIDYVVHHVKANGSTSPKVFKGWQLTLAPRETRALAKTHSLKPITTRVYYPGEHRVDVQANGKVVASASFVLRR